MIDKAKKRQSERVRSKAPPGKKNSQPELAVVSSKGSWAPCVRGIPTHVQSRGWVRTQFPESVENQPALRLQMEWEENSATEEQGNCFFLCWQKMELVSRSCLLLLVWLLSLPLLLWSALLTHTKLHSSVTTQKLAAVPWNPQLTTKYPVDLMCKEQGRRAGETVVSSAPSQLSPSRRLGLFMHKAERISQMISKSLKTALFPFDLRRES